MNNPTTPADQQGDPPPSPDQDVQWISSLVDRLVPEFKDRATNPEGQSAMNTNAEGKWWSWGGPE
ncbi:hypothetical protein PtA15_2A217 [Puccinia triticina]|uniref:Uncharacterized protein n=1 Tax=Puccinia triticina TaxID=208348 RepID=A0ABY7CA45_9BASI|nr:uncharacterized protein PtA15_2A217 [Puccinia triticina]WAQ81904.1 hypothetical protein PtA15_2A217 [Puccinia triticina]